jgi:hypothetical protein
MRKSKTKAEQLTFWPSLGLPDKEQRKASAKPDLSSSKPLYKSQQPPLGPTQKVKAQCQS